MEPYAFWLKLDGDDVTLARYTGTYNFEVDLQGAGDSMAALMASLDGEVTVGPNHLAHEHGRVGDPEGIDAESADTDRSERPILVGRVLYRVRAMRGIQPGHVGSLLTRSNKYIDWADRK